MVAVGVVGTVGGGVGVDVVVCLVGVANAIEFVMVVVACAIVAVFVVVVVWGLLLEGRGEYGWNVCAVGVVGGVVGGSVVVGVISVASAIELVMVVVGLVFNGGFVVVGEWGLLVEGRGEFGCLLVLLRLSAAALVAV